MIDSAGSISKHVGARLKSYRERCGLTQEDLAARLTTAGSNTSDKTVSSWETGRTILTVQHLARLANAFSVDLGQLGRELGLCGDVPSRDMRLAEGYSILEQIANEPPEVAETILNWLRQSIEMAKSLRVARSN